MKKTLLLISVTILLSIGLQAQEWNFGNDSINFPISAGVPTGTSVTIQGLTITMGGITSSNLVGQIEVITPKLFGSILYHHRFKYSGAGYSGAAATDLVPLVNMPTQRYVSFPVSGNCNILVHGTTGSSTSARKLFVTDGTNFVGAMDMPLGSDVTEATLTYTGPAATLYMFCNNSINLYLLRVVTITSIRETPAIKGVSFNGTQILNEKGQKIELYNISGKLIARSSSSIATDNLPKGIYVVRTTGSNGVLKFCK
jgi:hypothetical protein